MKPARNSSIELLRVITMYFIIAHHEVVNSGVLGCWDYSHPSAQMVFSQLIGMWGKTGINVFVLISGWFMCTSELSVKRFLKVFLEAKFYAVLAFVALALGGYEVLSGKQIFMLAFGLIRDVNVSFTGSFLAFYLFIPFYNMVLRQASLRQLRYLIGALLTIYTVSSTVLFHSTVFSYIGWYATLYFLAAYLRLYPSAWMSPLRWTALGLMISLALACQSVVAIDFSPLHHYIASWYFVSDSNKILALAVAVFAVLTFKNLNIGPRPWINKIAATTFGVYLIHTAGDGMRTFVWKDLFGMTDLYALSFPKMIMAYVLVPVAIFVVCSLIDLVRIRFLEKPFFDWYALRFG